MNSNFETVLSVDNMSCGSCVRHVEGALGRMEGVHAIAVNLQAGQVRIQHDPDKAPIARLVEALAEAGYASRGAR